MNAWNSSLIIRTDRQREKVKQALCETTAYIESREALTIIEGIYELPESEAPRGYRNKEAVESHKRHALYLIDALERYEAKRQVAA